jgi:Xaa-Pro aminopeptidase
MRKELLDLRRAMAQAGIDVYIIPTDDFHGSEYVGDYFKCREYVSGFTGSAGTLVVTQNWAGLWTDGRYFLQAAAQLAGTGIDLCKMGQDLTITTWLEENLRAGQVLGFDGRTMTAATGKTYETAAVRAGATLSTQLDLVGEIWADRPALSQAPAWKLDLRYTGRSRKDKLEALGRDLQKSGADCHILTSLDDLSWLLNIRGGDVACCPVVLGYLILAGGRSTLYVDEAKFSPELRRELEEDGISLKPYLSVFQDVKALPRDGKVLVDPAKLSYAIRQSLPEQVLEQANPTELPKAIKTAAEQENEVQAHIKDGVALTRFMKWLKDHVGKEKEKITEISAAQTLEEFRAQQEGYLGPSFDPIFGYGPHGAIVHYSATEESDAQVEAKGFLLSDTGGHYLEGSTDVTRTFVCGPLTQEMRRHYTLVLRGHLHLANAVFKQGCTGLSLDYLARQPLWEEGLDYNHGTGHGVGYLLSVHEGPQGIRYQTAHTEGTPLVPGMITSDEPGLYLENQYGIRLENLILCEKRRETDFGTFLGFRYLTMCPFELEAVEAEQLSAQERQWLNDYHAAVYEQLSPYMTQEENDWLKNATRAI